MNYREQKGYYNEGVVFEAPCGLRSELHPLPENVKKDPYHLAVFDMDRTTIDASSPMKLVKRLLRHFRLAPATAAKIIKWGISYKLLLPRENDPVREWVFTAFKGENAFDVSRELEKFAEEEIVPHVRKEAVKAMEEHQKNGIVVILLSASFDSVISRMLLEVPANFGTATIMKIDEDGNMTNEVEGTSPEGEGKPIVLKELANHLFGEGNWVVDFAYGDHMSDVDILSMAKTPVAVTPDRKLREYAEKHNWQIAEW